MADPLRDRLQSSLGPSCTLEQELGGGGMSHVFLARDHVLGRQIVVKVLPPDAAAALSNERFQREIALIARLQHANIVPLLSAGTTSDGLPFYTMPYVEGESLRQRLARTGELSVHETVAVLRDILRALAYSHARGIVHRDIKPDNVMLSGGAALVTDFGVAKAVSSSTGATPVSGAHALTLTQHGVALGTPAYMAPEQVSADPQVDHRADLYAFGCVAYELLTGSPPFAGRPGAALFAAHMIEQPEPIERRRPSVPPPLAALIMQCLEKRPADRPRNAEDVLHALEAVHAGETAATARSLATPSQSHFAGAQRVSPHGSRRRVVRLWTVAIVAVAALAAGGLAIRRVRGVADVGRLSSVAVLPFENTSRDTVFDYLEDGISDQVRDALRGVPGLIVKARSSSRQLIKHAPRDVGGRLGVEAVLQGTVSRSASRLHVTAELVRATDEGVLWSATFDADPRELAGIQDAIARAVADSLGTRRAIAAAPQGSAVDTRGTKDAEAYLAFLRGRHAVDRLDWPGAISLFKDAVRRDPRFARAYGYLAVSYVNSPTLGTGPVDSMNVLADESARHALALDSSIAQAYVARAFVLVSDMRFEASLLPLEKAAVLDSTNSDILFSYGFTLAQVGRVEDGLRQTRRAYALDPLSASAAGVHAYLLELSGQFDSSIVISRASVAIEPTNALSSQGLAFTYAFTNQRDSAVKYFEAAYRLGPTSFGRRSNLVFAYALAGRWPEAARERALLEREPAGNSPNFLRLMAHLAFGERGAAMSALERSVAAREALAAVPSLPCDPIFDPLKDDPRFGALMRQIGVRSICPPTVAWPIPLPAPVAKSRATSAH